MIAERNRTAIEVPSWGLVCAASDVAVPEEFEGNIAIIKCTVASISTAELVEEATAEAGKRVLCYF